jgi:general secretion pathway protein G
MSSGSLITIIQYTNILHLTKEAIVTAQIRKHPDQQGDEGFTLIELLIVVVILGILAGIVVFAVGGITDRGKDSACKTEKKTIQTAEEAYYAKNGNYVASAALSPGFLADPPTLYSAAVSGTTYAITVTAAGTTAGCT